MSSLRKQAETAANEYRHDLLPATLGDLRAVREVAVDGDRVRIALRLGFPAARQGQRMVEGLRETIAGLPGVAAVDIDIEAAIQPHAGRQDTGKRLPSVKNIVAVVSGKGGVGKSTVAANLALALAAEGASVGMLDADIYGPSQPRMLGIGDRTHSLDGKHIEPLLGHGIASMSIGYVIDPDSPTVWRGPMVAKALQQLLYDTSWPDLDYLIVDMPPGTGDAQLTLSQQVPLAGAVIVTTPQDIATQDARKGIEMFQKVQVPILGVVENMSTHVCSNCGHEEQLFGEGGGRRVAERYRVPLLGALPLDPRIREQADAGTPSVIAEPEGDPAVRFGEIALRMAAGLSRQRKDYARVFPKITISHGAREEQN